MADPIIVTDGTYTIRPEDIRWDDKNKNDKRDPGEVIDTKSGEPITEAQLALLNKLVNSLKPNHAQSITARPDPKPNRVAFTFVHAGPFVQSLAPSDLDTDSPAGNNNNSQILLAQLFKLANSPEFAKFDQGSLQVKLWRDKSHAYVGSYYFGVTLTATQGNGCKLFEASYESNSPHFGTAFAGFMAQIQRMSVRDFKPPVFFP